MNFGLRTHIHPNTHVHTHMHSTHIKQEKRKLNLMERAGEETSYGEGLW